MSELEKEKSGSGNVCKRNSKVEPIEKRQKVLFGGLDQSKVSPGAQLSWLLPFRAELQLEHLSYSATPH